MFAAAPHQALPRLRHRGRRTAIPADDNRERAVCTDCGTVHYENPLNVVGTVPVWDDQVLLCRRNIEPRYGLWTLPAGFMELGETTADGALRETDRRGRRAHRTAGPVHAAQRRARRPGALVLPRARCSTPTSTPAPRPSRRGCSAKTRCRGTQLAFRTVRETLHRYFEDRRRGRFERPLRRYRVTMSVTLPKPTLRHDERRRAAHTPSASSAGAPAHGASPHRPRRGCAKT